MFAPLLILSLGLCASAAALNRRDTINCTTIHTGPLGLFSTNQTAAPLNPAGVNASLYFWDTNQAVLVEGGVAPEFEFQRCDSEYMGYHTVFNGSTVTSYGHLVPVAEEAYSCIFGGIFLIAMNSACYYTDDSSQQELYWALTNDTLSNTLSVSFVGVTANGTALNYEDDLSYYYAIGSYQNQSAILAVGSPEPNATSPYELRFFN
ncbi:uncharacterized protein FIBRA_01564 [Fibroporia radiculosa]|uniref:Alginate lyase 2 domain-containing protein n=1 Tax=Fibroporia radiculosa TaxID=599839 RepID=J4I8K0_9APHY|nr:uncharacterized protein FIBRA_01564 [Fibroporia radiculosa]CCL99546.1 predicted protein [Fibroporia radiculosa]